MCENEEPDARNQGDEGSQELSVGDEGEGGEQRGRDDHGLVQHRIPSHQLPGAYPVAQQNPDHRGPDEHRDRDEHREPEVQRGR